MNKPYIYHLTTDPDFEKMMPLLSKQAYENIKNKIIYEGSLPTIVTWNKIIIKGISEYNICQKWRIPFYISEKNFSLRPEIISWICQESIKTKSLTKEQLKYCVGRLYAAEKNIFAANPHSHKRTDYPNSSNLGKYYSRMHTIHLLKDYYSFCPGKISVTKKKTLQLCKLPAKDLRIAINNITGDQEFPPLHSNKKRFSLPQIKKMPQYDPNAEISGLTLTIPMWVSSIERTQQHADFTKISPDAFDKLERQLLLLIKHTETLLNIIKEGKHVQRAAKNFDVCQINPVKVSRRDGINYVFNGQHTIEIIALVSGSRDTPVWCMIYDELEYRQEAEIFANQMKYTKSLSPYEIFMANIEAGNDMQLIIRDLVESYHLHISPQSHTGCICAVATLENIYEKYGFHGLDRTIRLIAATWEGAPQSFSSNMLNGIARLIHCFGEELKDDIFKDKLERYSIKEIARTSRERRNGSLGFSESILLLYNKKNQKGALQFSKLYSSKGAKARHMLHMD